MTINIAWRLLKTLEKATFAKHTKALVLPLQAARSRTKKNQVWLKSRRNRGRRKYLKRLLMKALLTKTRLDTLVIELQ